MKPSLILFDAGGTLLTPNPSVGVIYSRLAKKHGLTCTSKILEKQFVSAFKDIRKNWRNPLYYGRTLKESQSFWREVLLRTLFSDPEILEIRTNHSKKQSFEKLFQEIFEYFAHKQAWRLYPKVRETLLELREKGYSLGILSNWDARLLNILEEMQILGLWEYCFISCQMGMEKPDLRLFRKVLEKSKKKPEEVLFIGNDYSEDYLPAKELGIPCLLMRWQLSTVFDSFSELSSSIATSATAENATDTNSSSTNSSSELSSSDKTMNSDSWYLHSIEELLGYLNGLSYS